MAWQRPEHRRIADALASMNADWLMAHRCFFAGGTAIVMLHGEYRLSLDVDFLCADQDGYKALREAAVRHGVAAYFGPGAVPLREFRVDQYGLRTMLGWQGQSIRFGIIREARIALGGGIDGVLGVPLLAAARLGMGMMEATRSILALSHAAAKAWPDRPWPLDACGGGQ